MLAAGAIPFSAKHMYLPMCIREIFINFKFGLSRLTSAIQNMEVRMMSPLTSYHRGQLTCPFSLYHSHLVGVTSFLVSFDSSPNDDRRWEASGRTLHVDVSVLENGDIFDKVLGVGACAKSNLVLCFFENSASNSMTYRQWLGEPGFG